MKKNYYLLSLLFAGVLTFSLTACGDDDDNLQDQDNTSTTQTIIDSGKYGKFEVCTINGKNYYNCIDGKFYCHSLWYECDSYYGWKGGGEVEGSVVEIDCSLYEEPSIESPCSSDLGLTIPKSSLQKGKDITHAILNAYAGTGVGEFEWGGGSSGHLDDAPIVKSGSIKVANRSGDKVTLQFNNVTLLERSHDLISSDDWYYYDDSERIVTINGSVTCEYDY